MKSVNKVCKLKKNVPEVVYDWLCMKLESLTSKMVEFPSGLFTNIHKWKWLSLILLTPKLMSPVMHH